MISLKSKKNSRNHNNCLDRKLQRKAELNQKKKRNQRVRIKTKAMMIIKKGRMMKIMKLKTIKMKLISRHNRPLIKLKST